MKCHARHPGAMERSEASHGKVPGRAGNRRRSLRRHLFFGNAVGFFWDFGRRSEEREEPVGVLFFFGCGQAIDGSTSDPTWPRPAQGRPRSGVEWSPWTGTHRQRGGPQASQPLRPTFYLFLSFPTPTPTSPIPPPTIPRSRVSVELPAHVAELALYAGCRPPGDHPGCNGRRGVRPQSPTEHDPI